MKTLREILVQLKIIGGRVTGSYARGEQHEDSDLDIFIKEENWKEARTILFDSGLAIETTAIGQLATKQTRPRLEVSYRFHGEKKRLRTVVIEGITFKTK